MNLSDEAVWGIIVVLVLVMATGLAMLRVDRERGEAGKVYGLRRKYTRRRRRIR